ncbi:hypothetical protein LWI28_016106 [Acer negundo]|uniref:Uncharacterized protein n=1 Tax=Acer negundo TaxID=4023 RepID=A0AAD5IZP1_ACENE|nr:hypothetical protein LWI28_016106 [Acer negundo]
MFDWYVRRPPPEAVEVYLQKKRKRDKGREKERKPLAVVAPLAVAAARVESAGPLVVAAPFTVTLPLAESAALGHRTSHYPHPSKPLPSPSPAVVAHQI